MNDLRVSECAAACNPAISGRDGQRSGRATEETVVALAFCGVVWLSHARSAFDLLSDERQTKTDRIVATSRRAARSRG